MGMFDTVQAVNIRDDQFRHNGESFQTKSMDCDMSEYLIFNGQLWQDRDGETGEPYIPARPVAWTGELNIYTECNDGHFLCWVEYDCHFEAGKLVGVDVVRIEREKDLRDLSNKRPLPKSSHATVTIDFGESPEPAYEHFHSDLEAHIDAIRRIVGDPRAELIYPQKTERREGVWAASSSSPRYGVVVHNIVQDMSDFTRVKKDGGAELVRKESNGDQLTIILDEGRQLRN